MNEIFSVSQAIKEAIIKSNKLREGIIKGDWERIVGKLSRKSNPLYVKEGVLYILVEDSIFSHHMSLNKNIYLDVMEEILGDRYIKDLRFKISKVIEINFMEEKDERIIQKPEEFKTKLTNLTLDEKIEFLKKKSKEREEALYKLGLKKCIECGSMFSGDQNLCKPCEIKNQVSRETLEESNDDK